MGSTLGTDRVRSSAPLHWTTDGTSPPIHSGSTPDTPAYDRDLGLPANDTVLGNDNFGGRIGGGDVALTLERKEQEDDGVDPPLTVFYLWELSDSPKSRANVFVTAITQS